MHTDDTPLTFAAYTAGALRTAPARAVDQHLLNAALGLTGESGEFADHVKKMQFHGHVLDRDAVIKELGDVLWYCALAAHALEVDLDTVARRNLAKLAARYPAGFDPVRSQHRPAD